jgi:hypothetical protein
VSVAYVFVDVLPELAGQHVPVHLVAAGVGETAAEPAMERRRAIAPWNAPGSAAAARRAASQSARVRRADYDAPKAARSQAGLLGR